jgi:small subunit ribosomal protein S1
MKEDTQLSRPDDEGNNEFPGADEDWEWVDQLYKGDLPVELGVIGYNRGGLLVEARSLRGFVPISHVLEFDPEQAEDARDQLLASKVETQLKLKVIELEPARGRLVLSERAALADPGERNRLLERLSPGDCVSGTVTNITPFGVFIDLGGLEGLVHVSELSWGRVRHPEDVVDCGQEMQVKVVSVDPQQGRIGLSLKELQPDPWQALDRKYQKDELVDGVVTNVVAFGAFISLEEGLEGLIHVSELYGDALPQEGDPVRARIINVDTTQRRLGLSMRGIPPS